MARYTLLLAGLVALLVAACQQGQFLTPPGGGPGPRVDLAKCQDGDATNDPNPFVNKAYTLSLTFNPAQITDPTAHPPTQYVDPQTQLGMQIAATPSLPQYALDLRTAYCLAYPTFRKQLNDLTNVFIICADTSNCAPSTQNAFATSWGYRENANNQSALQHTYAALSADFWPTNLDGSGKPQPPNLSPTMTYQQLELAIISNLWDPNLTQVNIRIDPSRYITITPVIANDNPLTILAMLGHELGHIYWYKATYAPSSCTTNFDTDFSWEVGDDPPQFHRFGSRDPNNKIRKGSNGKAHIRI
jgi:hypothetical protein